LSFRARGSVDWSQAVLVVGRARLFVRSAGRDLKWHPGMLHARFEAGVRHPLARAVDGRVGELFLDATLGLGTDATFLTRLFRVRTIGVERSPVMAMMAAEGLSRAEPDIRVVCADATVFLGSLPDAAVDVVIGDPMFAPTATPSPSLAVVRLLGTHAELDGRWLGEARRVARRRVVVKDVRGGTLLERLGAENIERGGERTRYGVWCT
jgi:predicted methyltransferase